MRHPFHHQLLHDLSDAGDCSDLVQLLYDDSSCSSFITSFAMTNLTSCTNNEDSYPAMSSSQYFCSAGSNNIPVPMDSYIEG